MLHSTPDDPLQDAAWEMTIPYDQLDDVIKLLTDARSLRLPPAEWRKEDGRWVPVKRGSS